MKGSKNYMIVTDGITKYRLNRKFKIPKGLKEVFYISNKKIYNIDGELLAKHMRIQEIEPRDNINILTRTIRTILNSGYYHAYKTNSKK